MKTIIGELQKGYTAPNKIKQRLERIDSTFTCMISDFEPCDPENWNEISLSNPSSFISCIEEIKPYAKSSDIYYIRAKRFNKTRAFYNKIQYNDYAKSFVEFRPQAESLLFDNFNSVTRGCSKMNNVTTDTVEFVYKPRKESQPIIDNLIIQLSNTINESNIDDEIKATKLRLKVLKLFKEYHV